MYLMNMYCGPGECWAIDKAMNKTCKIPGFMVFISNWNVQIEAMGIYLYMKTKCSDTKSHIVVNRKGREGGEREKD